MTWNELKAHIETMDEDQRSKNVTIHDMFEDKFYPIPDINYVSEDGNGILAPNHPFLLLNK